MTPHEGILANANGQLGRDELFRVFLDHTDWRMPWPARSTKPAVIVAGGPASVWAFSSDEAYEAAVKAHTSKAIGPVAILGPIIDVIAELDATVTRLQIDPASSLSSTVQTDALVALRAIARGVRVERALAARKFGPVRAFNGYTVLYFGTLGQGHNVITQESGKGQMVIAFTAPDALAAFIATGSAENREAVNRIVVDGKTLFGEVSGMAKGVLVNPAGPRTFGVELAMCREIAGL
jgi:hypothetical protein